MPHRSHEEQTLRLFLELLLETNRTCNLTAITDPDEAWQRHILESLALVPFLDSCSRVIDIGSGGGVPGIPLAIALPRTRVTLLEATRKKARFLETVAERLALANIEVVAGRAETEAHHPAHRACYEAATCRAVGELAELLELAMPFLQPGGCLLAIKGSRADEEIDRAAHAIGLLGAVLEANHPLLPGSSHNKSRLLILRKTRETPATYPRRPGQPRKRPL